MVILLLPVPHFCYSMSICLALLGRSGHAVAEVPGQGYSKPPFSIQLSWTGIVDIGQKLRTNSDPSVTEISLQITVRLTDWGAFWEKKNKKQNKNRKYSSMVDWWLAEAVTSVKNKRRPECHRNLAWKCLSERNRKHAEMASLAEAATTNRFFAWPRCKPDREKQGVDMGKHP